MIDRLLFYLGLILFFCYGYLIGVTDGSAYVCLYQCCIFLIIWIIYECILIKMEEKNGN